jgi:hypothetical protein
LLGRLRCSPKPGSDAKRWKLLLRFMDEAGADSTWSLGRHKG